MTEAFGPIPPEVQAWADEQFSNFAPPLGPGASDVPIEVAE